MGKNLDSKCKQCRRVGEKLMLKGSRCSSPSCAMVKRNYPPGFHGPKQKIRRSDYGVQLNEKQKLRKQYNILEKQFKSIFDKAFTKDGDTGENLLKLLEFRLDNVIYRSGFAESRFQARQLVNHGHFLVNDKKVNIPSYKVKVGDIICIKKKSQQSKLFSSLIDKQKKMNFPSWINFDLKKITSKILHEPALKDINTNINLQMIVEYYSR